MTDKDLTYCIANCSVTSCPYMYTSSMEEVETLDLSWSCPDYKEIPDIHISNMLDDEVYDAES